MCVGWVGASLGHVLRSIEDVERRRFGTRLLVGADAHAGLGHYAQKNRILWSCRRDEQVPVFRFPVSGAHTRVPVGNGADSVIGWRGVRGLGGGRVGAVEGVLFGAYPVR